MFSAIVKRKKTMLSFGFPKLTFMIENCIRKCLEMRSTVGLPRKRRRLMMSQVLYKSDHRGTERRRKEKDNHGSRKLSKTSSAENGTESSPGAPTINNQVTNLDIAIIEEDITTVHIAFDSGTWLFVARTRSHSVD